MKIGVIDDACSVRTTIAREVEKSGNVCIGFQMIPTDISELEQCDAVIVDGEGIGNETYNCGVDFIMAYAPTHKDKTIIHYSGYVSRKTKDKLEGVGVLVFIKGTSKSVIEALTMKGGTK